MNFKLLAIGDVVGTNGLNYLSKKLSVLKREHHIDFCIVNGENASGVGLTPDQADKIFSAGADVITLGNHSWDKREIVRYIDDCPYLLRPANNPPQQPGIGYRVYDSAAGDVAVIDLIGRVHMDYTADNPFLCVERILKKLETNLIFVELHAEATSEKLAMGYMLDGRISALWGTHTHVPTADLRILPNGTGYVTDLGMTGPKESVLGVQPELSYGRFRGELPRRYETAGGACKMEGAIFTIDTETGRCIATERVLIHD